MIQNVTLKYYLNTLKSKGDKNPIYLRITYNRKKAEVYTGYAVEEKDWNEDKQRTKKSARINQQLSDTEAEVYEIVKQLEKDNKSISALTIKNYLVRKDKLSYSLLEFYESCIERMRITKEVEDVTIDMYGYSKNHVENFLKTVKKNIHFPLENVDYRFVSDYDVYLLSQNVSGSEKKMERNTASKHHSRLKTILIRAIKEGLIIRNPYTDFKLKKTASSRTYLSEKELTALLKVKLGGNQSLEKVRDIFLFSVYTGLRFEDAQALTMDRISKDKSGKVFLTIEQEKTNEPLVLPILAPAVDIISKYKSSPERKILNKVLPKISNQKLNVYLKVIADLAGIDKKLTHHVARHTCATTILLSNDVPIEVVSKWLGHTNIKTTQIYAKITNVYLQKVANNLSKKI